MIPLVERALRLPGRSKIVWDRRDESRPSGTSEKRSGVGEFGAMLLEALATAADSSAYRFRGTDLTRAELREEALTLARRLAASGLEPDMPIAIEIEHSLELAVAMCGVQILGACAVPIDPDLSAERREAILKDIRSAFVLKRGAAQPGQRIAIDIERSLPPGAEPGSLDPGLAFIVYTSGTSGGPKGVMISKEAYALRMRTIVPTIVKQEGDVDLAWTPSSFITMIDELFLPLLAGVPTVIAEPRVRIDPRDFLDLVSREGVTIFRITPSLLGVVLRSSGAAKALGGVRLVISSGETLTAGVLARAHDMLSADILGFYGATEAPAAGRCEFSRDAPPPTTTICTPQPATELRILTETGEKAEDGETGEIAIGGIALARGYHGKPDLTARKFVTAPDGTRLYLTGDLGRRLDDGRIEILGRIDLDEVGIRGVRVNLPEIRHALAALDGIDAAWVSAATPPSGGDPVLVAHCVAEAATFDASALGSALAGALPATSVPTLFLRHDDLPLTANGKTDVQALEATARDALAAPSAPAEADGPLSPQAELLLPTVLATAEETLGLQGLGGGDNFFQRGGNSLLAVEFALALGERIETELSTTLVFNTTTLREIAETVAEGRGLAKASLRRLREGGGTAPPIITVNATGNYARLAPHLDGAPAIDNVNMFGLTQSLDDIDGATLQDLAVPLARQILDVHPTGPWRLMAFCKDACLAVEIARLLRREGGTASLLLIDTFFQAFTVGPKMALLRALDLGPGYYLDRLRNRLKRNRSSLRRSEDVSELRRAAVMGRLEREGRLYRRFSEICADYRTTAYDDPVVLFVSREWRRASLSDVRRLAGDDLRVVQFEGLHNTIFAKETVDRLADVVNAALPGLAKAEER